ncbi:MAG: LLM class flavin-dependent oxidoreductase [Thermomicrobiales bacterium]
MRERSQALPRDDMKVGVVLPHWSHGMGGETPRPADVLNLARTAEDAGLDSVWLIDHFYSENYIDMAYHGIEMPDDLRGVKSGAWECWSLLPALATATQRVEIGTLVTNTGYRNPALLAKMADTVDDLSDGRLIVGLGAGDFPSEHEAYGYPFEGRVGRFEEALQIIRPMLRGECVTFDGEHYRSLEAALLPWSVRETGPPILIGLLHGGPRMKRLVVEHADQWNCWLAFWNSHPEAYCEPHEAMLRACDRFDRDPDTLERNVTIAAGRPEGEWGAAFGEGPLRVEPERLAACMREYRDRYDVRHITVWLDQKTESGIEWLARAAEMAR